MAEDDSKKFYNEDGTQKVKVTKTDLYAGENLLYRAGDVVPVSLVDQWGWDEGDLVDADSDEAGDLRKERDRARYGLVMNTGGVSGNPQNSTNEEVKVDRSQQNREAAAEDPKAQKQANVDPAKPAAEQPKKENGK